MKVNLLTAYFGGPYEWGKSLTKKLVEHDIKTCHTHNLFYYAKSHFWQNADVVHTTIPFAFKLWSKPTVVTLKGDYTIEYNVLQQLYPAVIKKADVVTTPSHYIKNKLGLDKAIVIPNAVDMRGIKPTRKDEGYCFNLATVMNFYFKGKADGAVHMLCLLDKFKDIKYRHIMVGDGPYLDRVKNKAKTGNMPIIFTGFIYEPRAVLCNTDIFLYYSYHDNFPNVILEAMAHGIPVITNKVGAVSEIIDNKINGYVAETDEEYCHYFKELISNPELRAKIGMNAREKVKKQFNWDILVDEYIKIYVGVL